MVNRQSENVGKIHGVVIDAGKNRMAYAVLSVGGFMGMGNKLFAIPWEAFEFSATENRLILDSRLRGNGEMRVYPGESLGFSIFYFSQAS